MASEVIGVRMQARQAGELKRSAARVNTSPGAIIRAVLDLLKTPEGQSVLAKHAPELRAALSSSVPPACAPARASAAPKPPASATRAALPKSPTAAPARPAVTHASLATVMGLRAGARPREVYAHARNLVPGSRLMRSSPGIAGAIRAHLGFPADATDRQVLAVVWSLTHGATSPDIPNPHLVRRAK